MKKYAFFLIFQYALEPSEMLLYVRREWRIFLTCVAAGLLVSLIDCTGIFVHGKRKKILGPVKCYFNPGGNGVENFPNFYGYCVCSFASRL